MAVLQGGGQNLPSPCVCYLKHPMWNRVNLLERKAETKLNKLQKLINANKLTINFDPKSQVTVFSNQGTSACQYILTED